MSRIIMLVPLGSDTGLTSVSMGILHAIERTGTSQPVCFFKPVEDHQQAPGQLAGNLISAESSVKCAPSVSLDSALAHIRKGQTSQLLEQIVANLKSVSDGAGITLVEGLSPIHGYPFCDQLNAQIAETLTADIVLVMNEKGLTSQQMVAGIESASASLAEKSCARVAGVIVNKNQVQLDPGALRDSTPLLGEIPWNPALSECRFSDIMTRFDAEAINEGEGEQRRVKDIIICEHTIPHMAEQFRPGALLVISADRLDMIIAACMASLNGVELAGLLISGGNKIPMVLLGLCQKAFESGLPVYCVSDNTWNISRTLHQHTPRLLADDSKSVAAVREYIALHISDTWVNSLTMREGRKGQLSPPSFRYQLTELARNAAKRIVLPEGDEPRTIKAAAQCGQRRIAECILLGDPDKIYQIAEEQGVELGEGVTIIDADVVRESYIARLVQLRGNKGMTAESAREKLSDNVYLGTMMLENDEVDGLVSGAVHTTANTVVPPLQIIKTAPDASIVSSVFFMLLPDRVLVYGDCAINPNPSAKELADIAIQSADSALAFGIEPRVAMISYSTGSSGKGDDVEKVREATRLAKAKRPDLLIDGPLQYDAAVMPDVAASKAPDSPVAGKATVFVFPDLNTGNTTYKAVQRSADLVSIGPMLQGMAKPVNDLSRGALVDDIVYTIALTAIQAEQANKAKVAPLAAA